MSNVIEPDPPEGLGGEDEKLTPTGEPVPDAEDRAAGDDAESGDEGQGLETDPVTGSTPADPSVDDSGLPPAGKDPMAGQSPSS